MYAWIWNKLPGPWWRRAVITLFFLAVLGVVFYFWFFPWLDVNVFKEPTDGLQ